MSNINASRRRFMQGCAAMGTMSLGSTLTNLLYIKEAAAAENVAFNDYKALVCIFLFGGNDSFNMLIPKGGAYADYASARGDIGVPEATALDIDTQAYFIRTGDDRQFGLHPELGGIDANGGVQGLYESGNMAFIGNVGTLLEPIVDAFDYRNSNKQLPENLFAHNHQQLQWQTVNPSDVATKTAGWGGRLAEQMIAHNANSSALLPELSMNISLAGQQALVVGNTVIPYAMSANGIPQLKISGGVNGIRHATLREQVLNLLNNPSHLMAQELAATKARAYDVSEALAANYDAVTLDPILYPVGSSLSAQLQAVAKMIKVSRDTLGFKRQIYFCSLGGWDTHADQNVRQYALLRQLSQALYAFHDTTVSLGIQNEVTTFTASDFGRTFNTNGDGSDHGWAGHQMVVGGAVNGGNIYGEIPELRLGAALDTGRGRFIPTTSVDQYAWTMARWFGAVDPTAILPNIGRFDSADLGFMSLA